jgi:mono/diheme cytochrome c family protein
MFASRRGVLGTILLAGLGTAVAGCASSSSTSAPPPRAAASGAPPASTNGEHTTTGSAPVDWPVPPEEAARVNPMSATAQNLRKGQSLFESYCTACHGVGGRGDGALAEQWSRLPKDLTHPDRQARMTDGEIFWKISAGHRQGQDEIMPGVGYKLNADDRWRLVLYVRSLATK